MLNFLSSRRRKLQKRKSLHWENVANTQAKKKSSAQILFICSNKMAESIIIVFLKSNFLIIFMKLRDRTPCVHCSCSRSCRVKYLIGDCLAFRHAIADYLVSAVYTCRYSRYLYTLVIKYFFVCVLCMLSTATWHLHIK